jgi:hypothetical protein
VADIVWAATGGALTRGVDEWSSTFAQGGATVSVDAGTTIINTRCLLLDQVGDATNNQAAVVSKVGILSDAGRRITFGYRSSLVATERMLIFAARTTGGSGVFEVEIQDGKLQVHINGIRVTSAGVDIVANTDYLIGISYLITSSTNFTIKIYVGAPQANNLALRVTMTNADATLANTGSDSLALWMRTDSSGAGVHQCRFDGVVVDDASDVSTPGDNFCTPKMPVADSSINWDTAIGSDPGAGSRYQVVDDRPLDTATGRRQAASSQATEAFTVEGQAAGDLDLSAKTIVGHGVWAYAKDGSSTGTVPVLRGAAQVPTGNPTTGGTVTIPATVQANDILICAVTSRDSSGAGTLAVTDNEGAGSWVKFANSTDHKATWWWKRASANTNSKTLTVANAVGSCSFVLKCFSGCITSGNPYTDVVVETNASADETHAGFTPTNGASMVLAAVHNYGNDDAVTNLSFATLGATTMTEKTSSGGSDCGCAFGHVAQSGAAAATGNLTWTQADNTSYSITCALISADPAVASDGTPQLIRNGTDVAVDLTSVAQGYSAWATSSTYPSGTFGMKSTGTAADTYLYELGAIIVYNSTSPASPVGRIPTRINRPQFLSRRRYV